jgi:myosin-5
MNSTRNCVGENVYIRDEMYGWLPAVITELDVENDRALVETKLPSSWKKHTVLVNEDSEDTFNQQKWVTLSDYPRHKLPRRSDIIVRDMADIPHLHEATMLYQIKERHAQQKPYTRVGEIVVAVNPCQWISDLYSEETQKAYACNLVWNSK